MDTVKSILLVEDSPGDVLLTQQAFRAANGALRIHVAADGAEALSFLRRQGRHFYAPRPELILLDLNLPRMDGRQVLAEIKRDDNLKAIPVIVLTTSGAERDVDVIYQLRASCFLAKPIEYDTFEDLVKSISDFWLTKAKLPPEIRVG